jgi:hypothetical protein
MSWTSASLGEVFVELQGFGNLTGDLSHFHRVSEAGAEVVGGAGGKDLGFSGEAAEGTGLDDAFSVALERAAVWVGRGGVVAAMQRVGGAGLRDCEIVC